jgi:predicted lipid-binding transport protein (Tim44 family)
MSDGFAYIDILFFAMVAAFIALRLRSVLGRRTGHERRRSGGWTGARANGAGDNVVALPERGKAMADAEQAFSGIPDETIRNGLIEIRQADPSFDLDQFLAGARAAFEMIVEAFSGGDKATLRPLLDDDVFEGFARVIDQREADGHALETQLVAVHKSEVAEAALVEARARVTVRFVSEQVNVLRDREGAILEGDPATAEEVVDLWTFERDTRSSDPNWALAETRTPQ